MSIFDRGSSCDDGTQMVSTQGRGIRVPGSRLKGAVGSHMGGGQLRGRVASVGCGKFGCGRDGKLCLGCKARGGLGLGKGGLGGGLGGSGFGSRPYAGEIPHTQQPPYGAGGGAGMAPQYVYPYYTTRGPRDFLMANPPTIGY